MPMAVTLQAFPPLLWNLKQTRRHQPPLTLSPKSALTKQGQRFLSMVAAAAGDDSATNRLIRKFITGSPKSVSLNVLSCLLSPNTTHPHLSSLALPLYSQISEASWFQWNSKLVAEVAALLDKQEHYSESEALISDAVFRLRSRERELAQFCCNLVEFHSKHSSQKGFDCSFSQLNQLLEDSTSVYIKQRAYESMISGLCTIGRPHQAEGLIEEMRVKGVKISGFEFKCVIHAYGKLGLFKDMKRSLNQMENAGFKIDTICANMVLSSYGAHNELSEMVSWLRKMKDLRVAFSVRTYNSVLNSCQTIMSLLEERKSFPLSTRELMENLNDDEHVIVKELIGSSVLDTAMQWSSSEAKLDLHGMHLASAYLIMLEWMEDMRSRLNDLNCVVPAEVTVVCGSGKHSSVRGESPVKDMVKEVMVRTGSPIRIDRKNVGCFVAKGKAVKIWLC